MCYVNKKCNFNSKLFHSLVMGVTKQEHLFYWCVHWGTGIVHWMLFICTIKGFMSDVFVFFLCWELFIQWNPCKAEFSKTRYNSVSRWTFATAQTRNLSNPDVLLGTFGFWLRWFHCIQSHPVQPVFQGWFTTDQSTCV